MNAVTPHLSQAAYEQAMGVQRRWIGQLAALVYPQDAGHAATAMLAYVPLLGSDFPVEVWCYRALQAVAQGKRRMAIPSYDEVHAALSAWWRDARPHQVALPAPREPDRVLPTQAEVAAVAATMTGWRHEREQRRQAEFVSTPQRVGRTPTDDAAAIAGWRRMLERTDFMPEVRAAFERRLRAISA